VTPRSGDRAVQFFDNSAEQYQTLHYGPGVRSFMTVRQARVLEIADTLGLPAGARVLDAGCGPGHLLRALASRGFRVTGMDASPGMLRVARATLEGLASAFPVSFALGNIELLPFRDGAFDLVCSNGVIEYLREDRVALLEMFRVLRPGGRLILPVTNAWSPINWFDFVLETLKRREWLLSSFNALWKRLGQVEVRARRFRVRRHPPGRFRAALAQAGFQLEDALYFHFLPWPHPLDRLLPGPSAAIGGRMERLARSWAGPIGEGYLALASKPIR
jgi:SAM-dependent methyltransferase